MRKYSTVGECLILKLNCLELETSFSHISPDKSFRNLVAGP